MLSISPIMILGQKCTRWTYLQGGLWQYIHIANDMDKTIALLHNIIKIHHIY